MADQIGKQTLVLKNPPTVLGFAAVGGKKEGEGPLGAAFDRIFPDSRCGEKTWEKAESKMQEVAGEKALQKAGFSLSDMDLHLAGDLLNQCVASAYGARGDGVPYLGLYGACSTYAEGVGLGALLVENAVRHVLITASSHFCTAERQYRYPLEYGGQRPPSAQWTATAAGAAVLGRNGDGPTIRAVTFGTVEDYGITDLNNMGAAMAPAAAKTLAAFFRDTGTKPEDFSAIFTGDLGFVGANLLRELLEREGFSLGENYFDCGLLLFDREKQQVEAGASGCGCSAAVASCHVLPKLCRGELSDVLFLSTGALMSPLSIQQGESIPGVAHLIYYSSRRKGGVL